MFLLTILVAPLAAPRPAYAVVDEARDALERARAFLTTEDGLVGVRPIVRYDSAFGLALGARVFDRRTLGDDSLIDARARVGTSGGFAAALHLQAMRGLVGIHGRVERNPRAIFAGLNGETLEDLEAMGLGRTRFDVDAFNTGVDSELRLVDTVTLRAAGDFVFADFEPGSGYKDDPPIDQVYDTATIPGFDEGTKLIRGEAAVEVDTRKLERLGTGFSLVSSASISRGVMDDPSRFVTLRSDARVYLGSDRQAFVLRLRGGLIEPLTDAPIPFDQLLSPTGAQGLRGISSGERRGPTELVGSLEYHRQATRSLDAVVFVDEGGAFGEDFDGLAWDNLEPSVGVGVRHNKHAREDGAGIPDAGIILAWAPDHGVNLLFSVGL